MSNKEQKLVEIARSFSLKLNLGNYETCDLFCSEKAEVSESEAETKSEQLYDFCKNEVIKSANRFLKERAEAKKSKQEKVAEQAKKEEEGAEWQKGYNKDSQIADLGAEAKEVEHLATINID